MKLAVYRRDNRKYSQRAWRRRFWTAGATLFLALTAVAIDQWGGTIQGQMASLRSLIIDNPYFAVREIQVRGGTKIGGREVVAMAGLRNGMSIWKIDPVAIEKKIARHPWVRHVLVQREFPRRVLIEVEERVPKAIIAAGKLYYVDGNGVVFKEVGKNENVNYPILTGLRPAELATSDPALRRRIRDALRLSELMTRDSHTLSEIHFDAADQLVLYTMKFPVALRMGWGHWEEKIRLLDRVLNLWKDNEARLASLDVSFRDQVIARLR